MDIIERLRHGHTRYAAETHQEATIRRIKAMDEAADEIERLRGMLIFALDGLDDYWITLPEGVELVNQIKALQQKDSE